MLSCPVCWREVWGTVRDSCLSSARAPPHPCRVQLRDPSLYTWSWQLWGRGLDFRLEDGFCGSLGNTELCADGFGGCFGDQGLKE